MNLCKVGLIGVAILGWAGAIALGASNMLDHQRTVPAMLVLLSLALFASGTLVTRCHQRPIGAAFDLGYAKGRRDAIVQESHRVSARQILDLAPIRSVKAQERPLVTSRAAWPPAP